MEMTDPSNPLLFFGIDVQAAARGCRYAVVDCAGESVDAGWVSGSARDVVTSLDAKVQRLAESRGAPRTVGIDVNRTGDVASHDYLFPSPSNHSQAPLS